MLLHSSSIERGKKALGLRDRNKDERDNAIIGSGLFIVALVLFFVVPGFWFWLVLSWLGFGIIAGGGFMLRTTSRELDWLDYVELIGWGWITLLAGLASVMIRGVRF